VINNLKSHPKTDASRRERFAWAMYDFANSGYSTVVLTAVFNAYFVAVVAGGAGMPSGSATALWTGAIATANGIVLLSGPVVGAIADHLAAKKPFLAVATVLCVVSTALLALAGAGDVLLATTLVIISYVMFASGENLISAFLPEIATEADMGRVSGYGWGIGYLGGMTTLGLCLAYITWAQAGGQEAAEFVPVTLLITAVMIVLASSITFLWLRERGTPTVLEPGQSYLRAGFDKLRHTLNEARRFTDLFRFLLSLVAFQAGVSTVFVVAAIYAQEEMGFTTDELVTMIMLVNVTAALGALAVGHVQDKFGSRTALSLALGTWIVALLVILVADTRPVVWVGANLIGIAMGACQASGRALIGHFTPLERTGEFYGLWGLAVNLAAIIGPVSYGLISFLTAGNQRIALLSTLGFFVLGWLLLMTVDETRGKRAASAVAQASGD
jgi:MFS transporter, UMF1 family